MNDNSVIPSVGSLFETLQCDAVGLVVASLSQRTWISFSVRLPTNPLKDSTIVAEAVDGEDGDVTIAACLEKTLRRRVTLNSYCY